MTSDDHTKVRPIRVPEGLWAAYGAVCQRLGTNRTQDLIAHMRQQINRHGEEGELDALAAAEEEMAERRSRMSPGRPRKAKQPAGDPE